MKVVINEIYPTITGQELVETFDFRKKVMIVVYDKKASILSVTSNSAKLDFEFCLRGITDNDISTSTRGNTYEDALNTFLCRIRDDVLKFSEVYVFDNMSEVIEYGKDKNWF